MRIFLASLALLIGLTTANAQIAGQNDPQFKAALAQWLDGKDLAALTMLSDLAMADNRAAQVFLGRVSEATHTHSHVTGQMERKARIALMRQVGGLSGKSWLKAASEDVPLAVALMQVKTTWKSSGAISALLDFGEVTATLQPLSQLLSNGNLVEAKELLAHPSLPDHAILLRASIARTIYYGGKYASGFSGTTKFIKALNWKLSAEEANNILFMWEGFHRDDVEVGQPIRIIPDAFPKGMIDSPFYTPLKTLCSERCVNDIPDCMRAIMIHQNRGTPIWITLASPVETLVSTREYYKTTRVVEDLLRLIRRPSQDAPGYYKALDQCSYEIMYKE